MVFRLDKHFFRCSSHSRVRIRLVYLDRGNGTWALDYLGRQGEKRAVSVTCKNSNTWKELNLTLDDARFGVRQSWQHDLILRYLSGSNTVFHMIELARK